MSGNKNEIKHEKDDLIFKNRDDVLFFQELKKRLEEGDIFSFNIDSLVQNHSIKKSKYRAKKISINDEIFDSKLEAKYYLHLLDKNNSNLIKSFELQPRFELQPSFKKNGEKIRKIEYIADFKVYNNDDTVDIIDTKGMVTPVFMLKKKMFEYNFPDLTLKLIKYVASYGGWIEHKEWERRKKENNKKKK